MKKSVKNKNSLYLILIVTALLCGCSKRETTKGEIVGLTYNKLIGHDWAAKAWYEYSVNGDLFTDTIYFYEDEVTFSPGTELLIEYQLDNPKKNKIKN